MQYPLAAYSQTRDGPGKGFPPGTGQIKMR